MAIDLRACGRHHAIELQEEPETAKFRRKLEVAMIEPDVFPGGWVPLLPREWNDTMRKSDAGRCTFVERRACFAGEEPVLIVKGRAEQGRGRFSPQGPSIRVSRPARRHIPEESSGGRWDFRARMFS